MRVAITDYMAHFGGPEGRAWRYRISTQDDVGVKPISLRSIFTDVVNMETYGQVEEPSQYGSSDLLASLKAAQKKWQAWPFSEDRITLERAAIVFSSSKGDLSQLEHRFPIRKDKREQFFQNGGLYWTCDHVVTRLAQGLRSECPVAACASGAHAIARATQMISWNQADWVLCGALEVPLSPLLQASYRQMGALSKKGIMRPFDVRRDGFMPSEGIAALVLENEEKAKARGVQIFGYVTGYDIGCDAYSLTAMCPSGQTIANAIERALQRAGNPSIDYINAHGTATHLNDSIETRGIASVFGSKVPVSSTKPLTGHLLGAAGAVDAVLSLQALNEQWAPPTLNLDEPDPVCNLDYIPPTNNTLGRVLPIKTVMSLNYGFGGHFGVLIFEKT